MARLDQTRSRGKPAPLTVIFLLALLPSIIAVLIVGGQVGWSFGPSLGCVLLLAATPSVTVWAIRLAAKIVHGQLPTQAALTLLAATFAGVIVLMVLLRGNDDMRCVDTANLTVTSANECQGTSSGDTTGRFAWYYGGSGIRSGETATDGSFSAPIDQGDDTGGSGGAGDDSGGGDEGGGDGGGADGGGGGGGE